MTFSRIPQELQSLNQWLVWRYEWPNGPDELPTKVPYNPVTGRHASVGDPQTWVPFDVAVAGTKPGNNQYDGIGFVFTDRDPYCGIDLDASKDEDGKQISDPESAARQQLIFEKMDSYSERSPSKIGLHIITKASVPNGRKRLGIEVYSSGRYFTFTGDVFHDVPIADRQELVTLLWSEMGASAQPNHYAGDFTEHNTDEVIYNQASKARNGDLFVRLWNGDATGYFSPSEADFALIDIIAFYTKNRTQIKRMFLDSALGKREKYTKANAGRLSTLTGYMISKSFDRMLPPVDISGLIDEVNRALAASKETVAQVAAEHLEPIQQERVAVAELPPVSPFTVDGFDTQVWKRTRPPGVLGDLTDYIYQAAPRPVYEIALAGALGLMAGITGRAFNVSGTGLNHYIMCLGATGTGKEAMASGIEKLLTEVTKPEGGKAKSAMDFVGPAEIASGQALLKHISERVPCFVSITGEFGLRLQQMSHPNATGSEVALRRVLLDLFNKSGAGQVARQTIYSDKKNNTNVIGSPAFSLLGESTPETFYKAIDEESVTQGLLPRFTIIEYTGPRVALNQYHMTVTPPIELVQAIGKLCVMCHDNMDHSKVTYIKTKPDALVLLNQIDTYADRRINNSDKDALRQLWNRLHVKTYKLAGLLAVANNFFEPTIDKLMVEWALSLVMTDTLRLLDKFASGEIGTANENNEQDAAIKAAVKSYLQSDWASLKSYSVDAKMHDEKIVPYGFLQRKLVAMACFRHDRRNATVAIKSAIQNLLDAGHLSEVPMPQLREKYKFNGKAYAPLNPVWFLK
jgi:hypothetical protein